MLRKIMVPVRGDGKGDNVLRHAATLAHLHKAHIEVTHCRPRPEDLMPYGVPIPDFLRQTILESSSKVADVEETELRAQLDALSRDLKLEPRSKATGTAATISFVEEVGRQVDVIKRHGRLADIIAVAQPDRDRNIGTNTLKAALFHSGRPVLMCPHQEEGPILLGRSVALAWNGSAEAARALSQSMPVLRHASITTLLTNGVDAGPGTTVEDVKDYLALHGVTANIVVMDSETSVGSKMLETCMIEGVDLLIMGAYGDSHERETLFGGNTQAIVDGSPMPVLFSH